MKFAFTNAKRNTGENAIIVSFFFNARGDTLEKTTTGMLRSILLQVLEKLPDLQNVLDRPKNVPQNPNGSLLWKVEMLQDLFSIAVSRLNKRRVICFIDALDECNEDEVRSMVEFFENLGDEASQVENRLYICFSSRHYPYIHPRHGKQLILEDQPDHGKDLERYVQGRLRLGKPPLIKQITDQILLKAAGVFMWTVLVVDILNKEFEKGRIFAVKARLQEIPDQLSELFKDMLRRDNDNMAELLLCIQWILYAEHPLKREEFYFAVVSGLHPSDLTEWDPEYISTDDMGRFVLSSSKGLAEVTRSKHKTVQFIHESVRDFLIKDNGLRDLWHELGEDFESSSHDRLKQCCLAYISIDNLRSLPSIDSHASTMLPAASSDEARALRNSVSVKFPFLEYAVHQVFYHANEAAPGVEQYTFLEHFPLRAWIDLDNLFAKHQRHRHTPSANFLYFFAEKDWTWLMRIQLDRDPRTYLYGERYQYPLFAAIAHGNRYAAKLILQHDLHSSTDKRFYSPTSQAPDCAVPKNQALLSWVAQQTDTRIVELLLDTGRVDVNKKDPEGNTPLSWAVKRGHEGIVRLLLDTGKVDINVKDNANATPLLWATIKGFEGIARLLFDTGKVDIDMKDDSGRIPLSWAARRGDEGIMRLLLNTGGFNSDMKDSDRQELLCWAAENCHKKIVQLLLDTDRVDPNAEDKYGRTPLLLVVQAVHIPRADARITFHFEQLTGSVVAGTDSHMKLLLLEQGRRGVPIVGGQMRHDEIVELLLDTDRVDPDAKDEDGRTPLSWAAQMGNEKIVQLLLATISVDPDAMDNDGKTPLLRAAQNGHKKIFELLKNYSYPPTYSPSSFL